MTKKKPDVSGSEFWPEFRCVKYVRALHDAESDVYTVHGSRDGDVWEVSGSEFRATYKPVTPNKS